MRSGPDRRAITALLAVVVLGLLLGVPAATGHTVGGQATPAIRLPPRPQAGQCLAPLDTPAQLNTVTDVVPFVACSAPHSAELLTVRTLDPADWPKRPSVTDATFTSGELGQACAQLAGQYLGWGSRNAQHRLSVSFFTRLTVSSELEWSVGQHWYACELMPGFLAFPISWVGTARNANNATPPSAFAKCADDPGAPQLSCDRPHHAEQLTQTFGDAPVTGSDCTAMAARVIGTADPTFGGALAVLARATSGGTECWVTTTDALALTGTLINHGSAPLPLG